MFRDGLSYDLIKYNMDRVGDDLVRDEIIDIVRMICDEDNEAVCLAVAKRMFEVGISNSVVTFKSSVDGKKFFVPSVNGYKMVEGEQYSINISGDVVIDYTNNTKFIEMGEYLNSMMLYNHLNGVELELLSDKCTPLPLYDRKELLFKYSLSDLIFRYLPQVKNYFNFMKNVSGLDI